MKSDFHMHSCFSTDSEMSPEEVVKAALKKGLKTICITDHHDIDFPEEGFTVDFPKYFDAWKKVKDEYAKEIDIRIGVELGLQPHLKERCQEVVDKYNFDFVLGSVHVLEGHDPHCGKFFAERDDEQGIRRAFEITLENIKEIKCFDVLGHMDYVVRYAKGKEASYSYAQNADVIDEILRILISEGKGIELNTAGLKYGLSFAHPHTDILRRYKELGGEIITIGSDGHKPEHLAYDFGQAKEILLANGFKYYTEFSQRKPNFCAIL